MADAKTPPRSPPGSKTASPKAASSPGQDPAQSPTGLLPTDHWEQQEPVLEDDESVLSEYISSSTASVTSSILNYRLLHGRRYHSDIGNVAYW